MAQKPSITVTHVPQNITGAVPDGTEFIVQNRGQQTLLLWELPDADVPSAPTAADLAAMGGPTVVAGSPRFHGATYDKEADTSVWACTASGQTTYATVTF